MAKERGPVRGSTGSVEGPVVHRRCWLLQFGLDAGRVHSVLPRFTCFPECSSVTQTVKESWDRIQTYRCTSIFSWFFSCSCMHFQGQRAFHGFRMERGKDDSRLVLIFLFYAWEEIKVILINTASIDVIANRRRFANVAYQFWRVPGMLWNSGFKIILGS